MENNVFDVMNVGVYFSGVMIIRSSPTNLFGLRNGYWIEEFIVRWNQR
jgi:hypothetical protein